MFKKQIAALLFKRIQLYYFLIFLSYTSFYFIKKNTFRLSSTNLLYSDQNNNNKPEEILLKVKNYQSIMNPQQSDSLQRQNLREEKLQGQIQNNIIQTMQGQEIFENNNQNELPILRGLSQVARLRQQMRQPQQMLESSPVKQKQIKACMDQEIKLYQFDGEYQSYIQKLKQKQDQQNKRNKLDKQQNFISEFQYQQQQQPQYDTVKIGQTQFYFNQLLNRQFYTQQFIGWSFSAKGVWEVNMEQFKYQNKSKSFDILAKNLKAIKNSQINMLKFTNYQPLPNNILNSLIQIGFPSLKKLSITQSFASQTRLSQNIQFISWMNIPNISTITLSYQPLFTSFKPFQKTNFKYLSQINIAQKTDRPQQINQILFQKTRFLQRYNQFFRTRFLNQGRINYQKQQLQLQKQCTNIMAEENASSIVAQGFLNFQIPQISQFSFLAKIQIQKIKFEIQKSSIIYKRTRNKPKCFQAIQQALRNRNVVLQQKQNQWMDRHHFLRFLDERQNQENFRQIAGNRRQNGQLNFRNEVRMQNQERNRQRNIQRRQRR